MQSRMSSRVTALAMRMGFGSTQYSDSLKAPPAWGGVGGRMVLNEWQESEDGLRKLAGGCQRKGGGLPFSPYVCCQCPLSLNACQPVPATLLCQAPGSPCSNVSFHWSTSRCLLCRLQDGTQGGTPHTGAEPVQRWRFGMS
jgi:hypothetical protein